MRLTLLLVAVLCSLGAAAVRAPTPLPPLPTGPLPAPQILLGTEALDVVALTRDGDGRLYAALGDHRIVAIGDGAAKAMAQTRHAMTAVEHHFRGIFIAALDNGRLLGLVDRRKEKVAAAEGARWIGGVADQPPYGTFAAATSSAYTADEFWRAVWRGDASGALRFHPGLGAPTETLAQHLALPVGLVLEDDGSLIAAVAGTQQLLRLRRGGDGRYSPPQPLGPKLPGLPYALALDDRHVAWTSLRSPSTACDWLRPWARKLLGHLPETALAGDECLRLVAIGPRGLHEWRRCDGAFRGPVTALAAVRNTLYFAGPDTPGVWQIARPKP